MSLTQMPGWFVEVNDQWRGSALAIEVEEVLHDEKSQYQHVIVFKSKYYGNVLVLDGVIQVTELDEISYHEPIAHLPLFSHTNPESVLIVGGGDGGSIREALKHESVKEVHICEIDQMVIDCAKKYLPNVSVCWDHPKVKLICGDASEYIKREENKNRFDVIISDTSDPVGPAEFLFEKPFYKDCFEALKAGGKMSTQGESMWNDIALITNLIRDVKGMNLFESVEYATTQIPTYPLGQIGFIVCSKPGVDGPKENATMKYPVRSIPDNMELNYYTSELHSASFVLPKFLQKAIETGVITKLIK